MHKLHLYEEISVLRVSVQCFILMLFDDGFYNAEFMERVWLELEFGSFFNQVCYNCSVYVVSIWKTDWFLNEAFLPASLCKLDLKDKWILRLLFDTLSNEQFIERQLYLYGKSITTN